MNTLTLSALPASWSIVDLAIALGLLLSTVVGMWRGLVREVMSLVGWLVAYMVAQTHGAMVGLQLPVSEPGSPLNVLAGMVVVFIGVWLAWALLTWAVRQVLVASGLDGTDRLLGATFGLLRGLLVALLLVLGVSMTPVQQWEPWQASHAVPWLHVMLMQLRPWLPHDVLQYMPAAA